MPQHSKTSLIRTVGKGTYVLMVRAKGTSMPQRAPLLLCMRWEKNERLGKSWEKIEIRS
jgi:hypothetical protein